MNLRAHTEFIKSFEEIYQRYRSALASKIIMIYTGADLKTITECSKGAEKYFGIDRDSLIGMDATELYENKATRTEIINKLIKSDIVNTEVLFKGGRYADVTITKRRDDNGNVIGTIGVARDKTNEIKLRQREIRLRQKASNHILNSLKSLYDILEGEVPWMEGHAKGVGLYSLPIAKYFGFKVKPFYIYAGLHDVGKVGMDVEILNSKKVFNRRNNPVIPHARRGDMILQKHLTRLGYYYDPMLRNIVRSHHEWFNGEGYPDHKKREKIPLEARIISVADAYDAMRRFRPYKHVGKKQIKTKEEALKELVRCSGTQFDPEIVGVFIRFIQT